MYNDEVAGGLRYEEGRESQEDFTDIVNSNVDGIYYYIQDQIHYKYPKETLTLETLLNNAVEKVWDEVIGGTTKATYFKRIIGFPVTKTIVYNPRIGHANLLPPR